MATATNGNEPVSNQKLAAALRDMQAVQPVAAQEEVYDLVTRVNDTARAIRDLASYSNHVADDLERITAAYVGHMQRLLGKIGK